MSDRGSTAATGSRRRLLAPAGLCLAALGLAACGSTGGEQAETIRRGKYKPYRPYIVGVPYSIKGERYRPREDMNYEETGVASWYGPGFHGKRTANGEEYNQNALTAAHRTLPMPTIVKVTNLENGRSVVVRINDRGPFADDRIIDLSKAAAQRIRMIRKGTARVRVKILRRETIALKRNGQVYANMAALNRRYVNGEGSGTVIASTPPRREVAVRPAPTPPATAAAVRTPPPPPPAYSTPPSGDTASGTMRAGDIDTRDSGARRGGDAGGAPKRLVGVPSPDSRRAWRGDVPPSDDPNASRTSSARYDARDDSRRNPDGRNTYSRSSATRDTAGRDSAARDSAGRDGGTRDTTANGDSRRDPPRRTVATRTDDRYARRDDDAGTRDDRRDARARDDRDRNGRVRPLARRRATSDRDSRDGRFHGKRPELKPAPAAGRIYVQAAAYTEQSHARRISRRLRSLAEARVTAVRIRKTTFYRVRLGPVRTPAEGDRLLARVVSMGYREARVVIGPARP